MKFVISESELAQRVRTDGVEKTVRVLSEALSKGELKPEDFSLRGLASQLVVGPDGKPVGQGFIGQLDVISEAAAQAVNSDAFAQINGQIFYNAVLEGYRQAEPTLAPEFGVVNSTNLRGERFAGVSDVALPLPVIPENQEYPPLQPSANYIQSPAQLKRGLRIEISREALMMDRTGELLDRCRQVGKAVGIDRELEATATLADVVGLASSTAAGTGTARTRYNWLGTAYATYQAATPWINDKGSNALKTALNVNAANILLAQMLDPFTNMPIAIPEGEMVLVVTPENEYVAKQIAAAIQLRTGPAGLTDTNPLMVADGAPPVNFRVVTSKYLARFLTLNSLPTSTWFLGSLKQAFKWIRALDITVSEALPGSHYMWSHDVVQAYKAGRIETGYTWEPRAIVRNRVGA